MVFLRISQFLTWPIAYVYFHLRYRLHINGRENLKKVHSPFIIIVNHFSCFDSFLFRLVLGFATPHLPLRFMAVERFNWKWLNFLSDIGFIQFIYGLFGVFVVVPGRGIQKNLEKARDIIARNRGNIVIYPEGKIVVEHVLAPFRAGAAVLATETNTRVLPVSFRPGEKGWLRRELVVNIGEPIDVPVGSNVNEVTTKFFDTIFELRKQN